MMKIGILTFHFSHNVGSALQAFALQKVISSCEYHGRRVECDIINYEKAGWLGKLNIGKRNLWRLPKWMIVRMLMRLRIWMFKKNFLLKYGHQTKRYSRHQLTKLNSIYDKFVVGSDQIWNLENPKVDGTYFLDFVSDDTKKIAYAPSFGEEILCDDFKMTIAKWLPSFRHIAVRERSGGNVVEEITGKRCQVVLDPTLLLKAEDYLKISKKSKIGVCVLVYIRDRKWGNLIETASDYAKSKNLPLHILAGTELDGNNIRAVGVREWLGLIKDAECIYTNSFHAVVFSILFNKNFYVEANKRVTRFDNILKSFGLEKRKLPYTTGCDENIDWNHVNKKLGELRKESLNYIYEAINN